MSDLGYPISILATKILNLSRNHPDLSKELTSKVAKLNAINKAINILKDEKKKEEIKEREELLKRYKNIKL